MPDPKPAADGIDRLLGAQRTSRQRLRQLEAPTGTQLVELKKTVENRLDEIPAEVEAAISVQSMPRAEIQRELAGRAAAVHQHSGGDITSGTVSRPVSSPTTVTAAGDGGFGGNVSSGGRVTASVGMTSPGVRANQVTVGYVAMYADQNGDFGYAPSTLSTKSLLASFRPDLDEWLTLIPKVFVYKDDPTQTAQLGFVAELVVKREPMLGIYDEQYRLRGIRYELLGVLCLGLIQAHVTETRATAARVDALAAHLGIDI